MTQIGAIVGVVTAFVAWYASAATVANSMRVRPILPVGAPIWAD
jgi:succinate-acetate transporter protein